MSRFVAIAEIGVRHVCSHFCVGIVFRSSGGTLGAFGLRLRYSRHRAMGQAKGSFARVDVRSSTASPSWQAAPSLPSRRQS